MAGCLTCVRLRFGFKMRCVDVFRKENSKKTSGRFPIFRWAQQGSLTRTWTKRGTRPMRVCQAQYLSAYIFGACCPDKDRAVALVFPRVNMDMMQLHLAEISLHVAEGFHAVVVLDCASWHTTRKLVLPSNVSLLPLPACSPELNSTERIWQQLRRLRLSNVAYENYDSIVDSA